MKTLLYQKTRRCQISQWIDYERVHCLTNPPLICFTATNPHSLQTKLKASVEVRKDWELQVEIEFSQISKLHLPYPEKEIQTLVECGSLEHYDKKYIIQKEPDLPDLNLPGFPRFSLIHDFVFKSNMIYRAS